MNTMIGAVSHDDGVVWANRQASRPGKASGFAPPHPELEQLPPLQQVVTPPAIAVAFPTFKYEHIYACSRGTHLVEEPAAAGITGAAVGDVGEPDGFFWSSSEDSKDVWAACLKGRPSDNLLEAALLLQTDWPIST